MEKHIHGEWDIDVFPRERLVLIKGRGSWNIEAANAYVEEFKQRASSMSGSPWLCLGHALEWQLGVPEMEAVIHHLYEWMADNGCIGQITLVQNVISRYSLEKMVTVDSGDYSVTLVPDLASMQVQVTAKGLDFPLAAWERFIERSYPNR